MLVENEKGATIITSQARAIYNKILEENKVSHLTIEQHKEIAGEINEVLARIVTLDARIASCGEKGKTRKISAQLSKAMDMLSRVRWTLEEGRLRDYPDGRREA